jgi:hypothetical protein
LPADVASLPWNEVNYVLNHKNRTKSETTLQFFEDVQTAIWLLIGDTNTDFPVTANAKQMINDAKAHPNFIPGFGDVVAVIIHSDGIQHPPQARQYPGKHLRDEIRARVHRQPRDGFGAVRQRGRAVAPGKGDRESKVADGDLDLSVTTPER